LRHPRHDTLLLVSAKQIDAMALQGATGQAFARACRESAGPDFSRRAFSPSDAPMLDKLRECGQVYREFQPTAVVGMGGFTSAIPLLLLGASCICRRSFTNRTRSPAASRASSHRG